MNKVWRLHFGTFGLRILLALKKSALGEASPRTEIFHSGEMQRYVYVHVGKCAKLLSESHLETYFCQFSCAV